MDVGWGCLNRQPFFILFFEIQKSTDYVNEQDNFVFPTNHT